MILSVFHFLMTAVKGWKEGTTWTPPTSGCPLSTMPVMETLSLVGVSGQGPQLPLHQQGRALFLLEVRFDHLLSFGFSKSVM